MYKILTFICVTSIYLNYDFCKLIILFLVNYLMANFIEIVTDCLFGMNIYLLKVRNKIRQYYIDFHFWYKQNDMKSFQNSAKVTKKVHQKNKTHFQKKNKGNFQKINKGSFQKKNKENLQKENKGSLKNEMNTKYKRQRNENLSQKIILTVQKKNQSNITCLILNLSLGKESWSEISHMNSAQAKS